MELKKVDLSNVYDIIKLHVAKEQETFVAPNDMSIVEAYAAIASGYRAYPFGLYDGEILVGFVMFGYDNTDEDEDAPEIIEGNYCIWRLMIDEKYQHQGYGRQALEKCIEYLKGFPYGEAEYVWLSYEPENTHGKKVYAKAGFVENGMMCGDEIVAVLPLK